MMAAALVLALQTTRTASPAVADDQNAVIGDLRIEEVAATAATAGGTTRITFTIENDGWSTWP